MRKHFHEDPFFNTFNDLYLICCGPSVQELKMYELKENSGRLFVPKPFTICYSKNQLDTTGANLISSYINQKMNIMMRDKLKKENYEFATYQEYIEYGKELSLLVSDLKRSDLAEYTPERQLAQIS